MNVGPLPTDGSTIYVRLWTAYGAAPNTTWDFNDYTYTTYVPKAALQSPLPPTGLSIETNFKWDSVAGASGYELDVGTVQGGKDYFSKTIAGTGAAMGFEPSGATYYVRLWTARGTPPNVTWDYNDYYPYPAPALAAMTSPAPGSKLSGASVTFTWSAGSGVTGYRLTVGTSATGSTAPILSQDVGLGTSQTVNGIPTDGSAVYVILRTLFLGSTPQHPLSRDNDYTYTAAGGPAVVKSGATLQPGTTAPVTPSVASTATSQPAVSPVVPSSTTIPPGTTGPTIQPASVAAVQPAMAATAPTPALAANPVANPALAPPASGATDQTPALLANFPVLGGAVRTYFSSTRGNNSWQELGNYTSTLTPDTVVSTYAPQLAAAGWNETSRAQSGDAAAQTLRTTLDLMNGPTHAHVVVTQGTTGGTNLALTVTTNFPGDSAPPLATGTTAAPATGATTSPSDRGAHDPANFPRLPGSVRTADSSTTQSGLTREVANYSAKCSPASADAFYAQSLAAAGWDELTRDENLNDATKSDQISATWQNGSRTAVIALYGSTAGGVEARVTVTTQAPGAP